MEGDMAKEAFDKIMAGLEDALAYAEGDKSRGVERAVDVSAVDVTAIRKKLRLSQARFAASFGLEKSAVQDWEQGRRRPDRAARTLLKVIESEPEAVRRALAREGGETESEARGPR